MDNYKSTTGSKTIGNGYEILAKLETEMQNAIETLPSSSSDMFIVTERMLTQEEFEALPNDADNTLVINESENTLVIKEQLIITNKSVSQEYRAKNVGFPRA